MHEDHEDDEEEEEGEGEDGPVTGITVDVSVLRAVFIV